MAHSHDPVVHHDREVIDNRGTGAGLMVAIAALVAIVIIGLAVLWAAPWDDDGGGTPSVPDVTDNSGGGVPVPGDGDAGGGDGGGGGTGGGEQPAQ